ncbi:MAG TPA: S8 family peptidase [Pyrinomonadaceae bacterium]|nr:S8 family peptidase [Pyrinomonadaceae bacterium]
MPERNLPHFVLEGFTETEPFRSPQQGGGGAEVPSRNRRDHGRSLMRQLRALERTMETARQAQLDAGMESGFGLQIEFESFPDIELAFESLARERSGIEIFNVKHQEGITKATVFVPEGKLLLFENMLRDYLSTKTDKNGRPLDHKSLINAIREIRAASLQELWTDDPRELPQDDGEMIWWEVWLPVRHDRQATVDSFLRAARLHNLEVAPEQLEFPERTVLLMRGSRAQLTQSMMVLNSVAELRRAKETADFFDALPPEEQPAWLDELLARSEFADVDEDVPHVCVLDTGINNGHPLLAPALADDDRHTMEPAWGVDDAHGHGTQMAGLALVGDLTTELIANEALDVRHRLESVKLLRGEGDSAGDSRHHGYLTTEAVARPEITAPNRKRVFGMAVTARDNRDRGRPSAWSSAIDNLASDADAENATRRLLLISGGNIEDSNAWMNYPASNSTDSIHDPGQAWNALTIGAYTDLTEISEPNMDAFQAVAPSGGLSPFSTTSLTWQPNWPLKPDVVFEGGNAAQDALSAVWTQSLSLLTTNHLPVERLFTTANATSAATALAAKMAAQLMSEYPNFWPECIRALIVHSAEWTKSMFDSFLPANRVPTKADVARLIRYCGFGVPDLMRAMRSANNSLAMIVQEEINPFIREDTEQPKTREMHLHRLPWPLDELEDLGEEIVEMRVTLSYFIEPNPSARGVRSRYRYESYGLRFDVKRPAESDDDFRTRINAAARDEEEGTRIKTEDPNWAVGTQNRHKGSIHSDIWRGTASDLASRGVIGVYPALGWWKTRTALERYNKMARYALVVSIDARNLEVDLYTPIANQIGIPVEIEP